MNRKIFAAVLCAAHLAWAVIPANPTCTEWEYASATRPSEENKITLEVVDTPVELHGCALLLNDDTLGCIESSEEPAAFEPEQSSLPDQYEIAGFPIIWQMPELPTGCEVTALTMALRFYGYDVSKTEVARRYLPTEYPYLSYGSDGNLYGPDLNQYFVGDPFSDWGYICGVPAILTAANDYLVVQGGGHTAINVSGSAPEELYALVAQDTPVVVWVTIEMADRYTPEGWYTESGEYVDWSTNDHGAVLVGYSEETVTIADPISGLIKYDRQQFESVFESRGRQCMILCESQEVAA